MTSQVVEFSSNPQVFDITDLAKDQFSKTTLRLTTFIKAASNFLIQLEKQGISEMRTGAMYCHPWVGNLSRSERTRVVALSFISGLGKILAIPLTLYIAYTFTIITLTGSK